MGHIPQNRLIMKMQIWKILKANFILQLLVQIQMKIKDDFYFTQIDCNVCSDTFLIISLIQLQWWDQ